MNFKTEASRLAGCQGMDGATFERDIEMALENIAQKSINKAAFALEQIHALTVKRMNASLPKDPIVININKITTNFFKE